MRVNRGRRRSLGIGARRRPRHFAGHGRVPEGLAPLQLIGKLTLNRNPANYFAETEQVAFHSGNLAAGITAGAPGDVTGDTAGKSFTDQLAAAVGMHRAWDRAPDVMASAVPPALTS